MEFRNKILFQIRSVCDFDFHVTLRFGYFNWIYRTPFDHYINLWDIFIIEFSPDIFSRLTSLWSLLGTMQKKPSSISFYSSGAMWFYCFFHFIEPTQNSYTHDFSVALGLGSSLLHIILRICASIFWSFQSIHIEGRWAYFFSNSSSLV